MQLSVKTKLDLTQEQENLMARHAGFSRWVFNWGLEYWQWAYNQGLKPNHYGLKKFFNNYVKPEYAWMKELNASPSKFGFDHLGNAFNRFFKKQAKYPNFKKKGVKDSFTLDRSPGKIAVGGTKVKLPKPFGWVKSFEGFPQVEVSKVTISREADGWYISFTYEQEKPEVNPNKILFVGVDLGINTLATLSTGVTFNNPKAYRKAKKQLARLQRQLQRKEKGSRKRERCKRRLAKTYQCVANVRKDTIHKMTHYLCKNHAVIGIEDLNVSGMMANHKLSSAVADCGFYEISRQIEYKAEKFSSQVVVVDRFYPSSQICSSCGHQQKMPLSERIYHCGKCGQTSDRDLNAARNLSRMAQSGLTTEG